MATEAKKDSAQLSPYERIRELEQENIRLSRLLEERKALEERLRESEYRFRALADGTPVIIWVTNADGRIEFVNKAYSDFLGVTQEQVQSIGWQILVHPEDHVQYVDEYLFCHEHRRPFHAQGRIYHKDGTWRWIESYAQPRFSEKGDFLGMAGSSLDITERIRAEEALRESEAKFHASFENAAIGFAMATPAGRFIDMNEAFCRLVGYSRQDLLHLEYFQLIHPRDVEENIQILGQLLRKEIPSFVMRTRYIRKDGQVASVRKSLSAVFVPSGEPKWFLTLVEELPRKNRSSKGLGKRKRPNRA